jgi:hypothetical protein
MMRRTDLGRQFKDPRAGKRANMVWHRRTGKDLTCFADHVVPAMHLRKGIYHYYFPTAADGRAILWDGGDREGVKFLDRIPRKIIKSMDQQQMKITLTNGSLFQVLGTDRMERVGTNPFGCVFSEFSKQNPKWWDLVRPILAENGGWAMFNWTPRGKNHAYRHDRMSQGNPKWFYQMLTVDDTHAITQEAIEDERRSGMSEEMIQQEFYCSYDVGVEGSYYGRVIAKLWQRQQICHVPIDPNALVHTVWDLGFGDSTAIWFFQICGNEIHLIDYYECYGEGMSHYINVLEQRRKDGDFLYGTHFAPHDIRKGSLATGKTLLETALELGIKFYTLQQEKIVTDGIERTRGLFHRCWFDQEKCKQGIDALENYHKPYKDKLGTYGDKPVHDWASHGADAFRYLSLAIKKGLTSSAETRNKWKELKESHR